MSINSSRKRFGQQLADCSALAGLLACFAPDQVIAQGLPVETGSHLPVWLWFIGAGILGLAIAYGIVRNSKRNAAEKATTERATKDLYAKEDRERT
jgi:hypothetical protein